MNRIIDLDSKFNYLKGIYYHINVYTPDNLNILSLIDTLNEEDKAFILRKSRIFPKQTPILKAMILLISKLTWFEITQPSTQHGYFNCRAERFSVEIGTNTQTFATIVKILTELGIIQLNPKYSAKSAYPFSRSFKFTKEYAQRKPKLFEPRFIVSERETIKWLLQVENLAPVEDFLHDNLKRLRFSISKESLLEIVRKESNARKGEEAVQRADYYINAINSETKNIDENGWNFTRSEMNGRIFTTVTSLKRELRAYLVCDGQNIVELDQHASQPFLMLKLYEHVNDERMHIEREKYYSLFSSNFYHSFAKLIGDEEIKTKIKDNFIKVMNSPFKPIEDYDRATKSIKYRINRAFAQHFPILYSEIHKLKTISGYLGAKSSSKGTHTQYALYLQNLESNIFIDGICGKLLEKGIFCYTVHDCIGVLSNDVDKVKKVMETEIENQVGFLPVIKIK